ncbi:restriction endonuclease subunit S [Amycolatopsis sp. NPDC026612]|uniref:restriction endonuclease subunit S n=1 Tax=Amycolatopsis sp. NPDC026612 TaxID=3155466 RepID=UPI0033E6B293
MSRIDDLLKALAPEGVPLKALGDVGEFIRGNGLQKSNLTDEGVSAIHYGQVHTIYGTWTTKTVSFVDPDFAKSLRRAASGDLIVVTTSEDDKAVAKAVAWLGDEDVAISGDAYIYRHTLDPKFVAYYLQSDQFQNQKKRSITGTKVRRISGDALARILIPVPPIEIQAEIALILDRYSRFEAELKAQLGAEMKVRREQFNFFRTQLLTISGGDVHAITLPEVSVDLDSHRRPVTKSARVSGKIPYYGASGIVDYVSDFIFDGKYLLVSEDGANLLARSTPIAFSISGKSWVNNHAHVLEFATDTERRFVELYLNSIDLAPYVTGAAQPKLNKVNLNSIRIPWPTLSDQARIVSTLDSLEASVGGLVRSLSDEIIGRHKQYAYYRDRLFAFERLLA